MDFMMKMDYLLRSGGHNAAQVRREEDIVSPVLSFSIRSIGGTAQVELSVTFNLESLAAQTCSWRQTLHLSLAR